MGETLGPIPNIEIKVQNYKLEKRSVMKGVKESTGLRVGFFAAVRGHSPTGSMSFPIWETGASVPALHACLQDG
jgi:hypothetical protein